MNLLVGGSFFFVFTSAAVFTLKSLSISPLPHLVRFLLKLFLVPVTNLLTVPALCLKKICVGRFQKTFDI